MAKKYTLGRGQKVLGEYLTADSVANIQGYTGNAVGFALGMDWSMLENSLIGVAGSAMKVNMVDSNKNGNTEDIQSYMLTFYGFFNPYSECSGDYVGWYTDGLLGIAATDFKNVRNINIGTLHKTAHSTTYGTQLGAQLDTGYAFLYDNLYMAPIGRVKYTYLLLEDYTETGAGGLDLSTTNGGINELLAGLGFRMAAKLGSPILYFFPEASLMYLYDFEDQTQQTVANFLGGGTAFPTYGVAPGRDILLFDLGITAASNDGYVFTGTYELEYRNHFLGNSGFLELYRRWS